MSCFSKVLRASAEYKTISNAIREHRLPAGVTGVSPIHKAHLVHSLCEDEAAAPCSSWQMKQRAAAL